jgi:hypothetical protein
MNHPAVVAFYSDHGDVDDPVPFTKLLRERGPDITAVDEEVCVADPFRMRVDFPIGEHAIRTTLDGTLSIVGIERDPSEDGGKP